MKTSLSISLFMAALAMTGCSSQPKQDTVTNPILSIEGGRVQGQELDKVIAYKGIPFAAAPVGNLRWRAPQPVQPWDTVMIADHFRNASYQVPHNFQDGDYGTEFFPEDAPFSEDCLQLNVWTPSNAAGNTEAKLPVTLWIHGGAYMCGWSFEMEMDGEAWAQRDVILVTANYRLGGLGFLSHPLLTERDGQSGNYGLMDQIAALKWVKRNIAQFGGDPDNVTIMGQSAGGGSIRCLCIAPESKGLMHRAIIMSAGGLGGRLAEGTPQSAADEQGKAVLAAGGLTTLEQMYAATGAEIQATVEQYNAVNKTFVMMPPHVDGKVLTQTFDEAVLSGTVADVPYMIGSVANDMPGLDQGFQPFAEARQDKSDKSVYIYRFDAPLPDDGRPCLKGSFHSSELWYVFHTQSRSWRPFTAADNELSDRMVDYWTNFAKYGNPNGQEAGAWKPSTKETPYVHELTRKE